MAVDGLEVRFAARIAPAGPDGRFRIGPLRPGKYQVYPGSGADTPIRKAEGARDTPGEITVEGEERDLGDIALPVGARLEGG